MHRFRPAALAAVPVLSAAAVLATAATAHAHISIDPAEAEPGSYRTVHVKVPNERDDASTVEVELHLDPEHPLASVMPQPVPGWEVEVETTELDEPVEFHGSRLTEVPSVITWRGGEIGPGMFQQFPLSVGPLPEDADRLVFDALQTYDSGEIVRWIEEPVEGEPEPEHPSPVLTLVPAAGGEPAASEAAAGVSDGDETAAETADEDGDSPVPFLLSGLGVLLGGAGLVTGLYASRRAAAPAAPTDTAASDS
jgi:uncharacterized protein YcnI